MKKFTSTILAALVILFVGANALDGTQQVIGGQKSLESLSKELSQLQAILVEHEERIFALESPRSSAPNAGEGVISEKPKGELSPQVAVKITNKRFDQKDIHAGDFSDNIWWDASYKSNLEKGTRSVKGVLQFCDLFGDPKFEIRVTIDEPISPGATVEISGIGFEYNQFLDEHRWLRTAELKDMTFKLEIEAILYSDGTLVKF